MYDNFIFSKVKTLTEIFDVDADVFIFYITDPYGYGYYDPHYYGAAAYGGYGPGWY